MLQHICMGLKVSTSSSIASDTWLVCQVNVQLLSQDKRRNDTVPALLTKSYKGYGLDWKDKYLKKKLLFKDTMNQWRCSTQPSNRHRLYFWATYCALTNDIVRFTRTLMRFDVLVSLATSHFIHAQVIWRAFSLFVSKTAPSGRLIAKIDVWLTSHFWCTTRLEGKLNKRYHSPLPTFIQ